MIHILQSRQRLRMPLEGQTYCWWKNSGDHQLIGSYLQGFLYIPGGCFGFQKNHQLYVVNVVFVWHLQLGPYSPKRWSCVQFEINKLGVAEVMAIWNETAWHWWPKVTNLEIQIKEKTPRIRGFFRSFFHRDAQVDVSGLLKTPYFQKWRKMSNSWVTKTVWRWICKSCILRRPDTKATPWKDLRSDLCEILTLKARFMTSSNLLSTWYETDPKSAPCLAVWMIFTVFFFAKRPFTSTQVKPRLASLEKEVTRSNFSSHQ